MLLGAFREPFNFLLLLPSCRGKRTLARSRALGDNGDDEHPGAVGPGLEPGPAVAGAEPVQEAPLRRVRPNLHRKLAQVRSTHTRELSVIPPRPAACARFPTSVARSLAKV